MTSNINFSLINPSVTTRQERRALLRAFWLAVAVLLLVEIFTVQTSSITSILGAILITFAALLPLYLWCSGKALGLPIFPFFALTYLWTYALPIVSNHKKVVAYSSQAILFASITVATFLGLGTLIWFQFVKSQPAIPKSYRVLKDKGSEGFFLGIMAFATLFNICFVGNWFELGGGTFALVRGTILGLNALSVFVLSYRSGTRELAKSKTSLFLLVLCLYILSSAASLLLVGALSAVLLAAIAFIAGRRRVPWLPIILVIICISFLHYGKAEMRVKYWQENTAHYVQPWEYPAWYAEWTGYSLDNFGQSSSDNLEEQSFTERASLIHLLLIAQTQSPKDVPYLSGATYAIIPQLLVPRFLNKDKIRSHEGTSILNIHYGLQNRKATFRTTIGWGLLNEAYANFGLAGCTVIAIILGLLYGQVTRWSIGTSLLSFRSLFAVLVMSYAYQSEFSAGVYIAALFQSLVPLIFINLVFMKVQKQQLMPFTSPYYSVRSM